MTAGNVSVNIPEAISTIDLTKRFSNSGTSVWQYLPKVGTNSGNTPPTLNDGSIFATKSNLYLFGGALSAAPGAPTVPPPNGIWQYEFSSNNWTSVIPSGDPVKRIHWGSNAQAVNSSKAYFLGGALTPKSDPVWIADQSAMPYMVQGLISVAEDTLKLSNSSTTGLNLHGTQLGGFMALIESLGSEGVIVAFGGITNNPGRPMQLVCQNAVMKLGSRGSFAS